MTPPPIVQICLTKKYQFSGLHIDTGGGFVHKDNVEALAPLVVKQIRQEPLEAHVGLCGLAPDLACGELTGLTGPIHRWGVDSIED